MVIHLGTETQKGERMKRLTVDLDDKKHTEFKTKAASDGTTMREVVNAAIEAYLAGRFKPTKKGKAKA